MLLLSEGKEYEIWERKEKAILYQKSGVLDIKLFSLLYKRQISRPSQWSGG